MLFVKSEARSKHLVALLHVCGGISSDISDVSTVILVFFDHVLFRITDIFFNIEYNQKNMKMGKKCTTFVR